MSELRKAVRWYLVALWTLLLIAMSAAIFYGPVLAAEWNASRFEHRAGSPKFQAMLESGELRGLDTTDSIRYLLPYESISLETTPCFGNCPVFFVTFHRDGRAELIENHSFKGEEKYYKGRIGPESFVRITQLALLASAVARESDYSGQWTDDTMSTIRATTLGRTWEVSDYGGVSPPEVWVLELVLRDFKSGIEWAPSKRDAG